MFAEVVGLAFQAIRRNALRSFLTVLGVIIGTGAVIGVGSIIAGATRPEQVTANAAAASGWRLTVEEMSEVDRLTK